MSQVTGNPGNHGPQAGVDIGFESLLGALSPSDRASLLRNALPRKAVRGAEFRPRGDRGALVLVRSGTLRIDLLSRSGRVASMLVVKSGEWFGGFARLAGAPPYNVLVTCEEDAELLELSAESVKECLASMPALAEAMLMRASKLILSLADRIAAMAMLGLRDQLLTQLLNLTRAEPGNVPIELNPTPTHAEFAALFGVTRESVTRELSALARTGILKTGRSSIVISSRNALIEALSDQVYIRTIDDSNPYLERDGNEVLHPQQH